MNLLVKKVTQHGVKCDWDKAFLKIGDDWWAKISVRISNCDVFLLYLSPNTFLDVETSIKAIHEDKDYVIKEIRLALSQNKIILPISVSGEGEKLLDGLEHEIISQIRRRTIYNVNLADDEDVKELCKSIRAIEISQNSGISLEIFALYFALFTLVVLFLYFFFR